ncbi:MAG: hypothetical protein JWQ78_495, partial [Sediminibacterium sp.]|nr:hypothetical protein [Sediminibacterium sp.]
APMGLIGLGDVMVGGYRDCVLYGRCAGKYLSGYSFLATDYTDYHRLNSVKWVDIVSTFKQQLYTVG